MEVKVYIQEKTQNYKGFILDTKEDIITIKSNETVIFSNGLNGIFTIEVWYSYKGNHFSKFSNFIITTQNNEENQHKLLNESLIRLIKRVFFDVSVFDTFKYVLKHGSNLQNNITTEEFEVCYNSDPVFYNSDYHIKERTEYYKEFIVDIIWGEMVYSEWTNETVIFNNGMKATFPFEVHIGYCSYSLDFYILFSCMHITLNNQEVHDENARDSVKKIIERRYFDSFTSDILLYTIESK